MVRAQLAILLPLLAVLIGLSSIARAGGGVLHLPYDHTRDSGHHKYGHHHQHDHSPAPAGQLPLHKDAPCMPPHVHLPLVDAAALKIQRAAVDEPVQTDIETDGHLAVSAPFTWPAPVSQARTLPAPWRSQSSTDRLRTTRMVM
jgi:hypothetical protein